MKKFLNRSLFILLFVGLYYLLSFAFNYYYDPYGLLGRRTDYFGLDPNLHSLKIDRLVSQPKSDYKLLFSDSRGGNIDMSDHGWYNVSYPRGFVDEFLHDIEYMLDKGVTMSEVAIFVDEHTLFEDVEWHNGQALLRFVELDDVPWIYYVAPLDFELMKFEFYYNYQIDTMHDKFLRFDVKNNGVYYEHNFEYCDSPFVFVDVSARDIKLDEKDVELFENKYKVLDSIRTLCAENGINCKFFKHPISTNRLKEEEMDKYFLFLEYLKDKKFEMIPIFSSDVMKYDECLWRDNGHYNRTVSDKVATRILEEFN